MSAVFGRPLYFTINSADRINSNDTAGKFSISLDQYKTGLREYDSICLLNFAAPKSWYLIGNNHNSFIIIEEGIQRTITLTTENYTFSTLKTELQYQLNQGCPVGYNYAVTANTAKGKYTIICTGYVLDVQIIFDEFELATILGFLSSTTYTLTGGSLTSVNIVRLQLVTSILLTTDLVNAPSGILCNIPVNASDLSNVTYTTYDVHMNSRPLASDKTSVATFTLISSETQEIIDFNGVNISFDIILYKRNDLDEKLKQEAMIKALEEKLKSNLTQNFE